MSEKILVKMVPYNRATRHMLRRLNYRGTIFLNDGNWRSVAPELAAELRKVRSSPEDPSSPLAFLVMSESQARQWEVEQRRKNEDAFPVVGATDMEIQHPSELMGGDPVVMDELRKLRAQVEAQGTELREERRQNARLAERLDGDGGDEPDGAESEKADAAPVVDPLSASDPVPVLRTSFSSGPKPAPKPAPAKKKAPAKKAPKKRQPRKKGGQGGSK